jgi:hypothetical protein
MARIGPAHGGRVRFAGDPDQPRPKWTDPAGD